MNTLVKKRLSLGLTEFLLFLFLLIVPLVSTSLLYFPMQDTLQLSAIDKTLLYQTCLYLLFLAGFLFLLKYSPFKKRMTFRDFTFSAVLKAFSPAVTAFFVGAGAAFLLVTAASYLDLPRELKEWIQAPNPGMVDIFQQIKNSNFIYVALLLLYTTIIGPVYEEILFRGFLQNSFSLLFRNKYLEIFLTALLFALAHMFSIANALFSFCVGIVLSQQKKMSNNIHIPICIHSIINCMGVLFGFFLEFIIDKKG